MLDMWVDYPGKQPNAYENASIALAAQRADGSYTLRWPNWNLRESWAIECAYVWDPMPWPRFALLLVGAAMIAGKPGSGNFTKHELITVAESMRVTEP